MGERTRQTSEAVEQPALFTERELLEAQQPEVLRAFIEDSYLKIHEIEQTIKLAKDVYEGTTGEEYVAA